MKWLKAATAGLATSSPAAVQIRASEMPTATRPGPAPAALARSLNARMTPSTVPNRPMNGATEAMVPKVEIPFSSSATARWEARSAARLRSSRLVGPLKVAMTTADARPLWDFAREAASGSLPASAALLILARNSTAPPVVLLKNL